MFKNKNTFDLARKKNLVTNNVLTRLRVCRMESRPREHLWRVGGGTGVPTYSITITTSILVKFSLVTDLWVA
jgi:precorrin-6B methylase 2